VGDVGKVYDFVAAVAGVVLFCILVPVPDAPALPNASASPQSTLCPLNGPRKRNKKNGQLFDGGMGRWYQVPRDDAA
jgi:hypothetical protein